MSIELCFFLSEISYESNSRINDIKNSNFKTNDILINKLRDYFLENNLEPVIKQKYNLGLPNICYCLSNDILYISFSGLSSYLNLCSCLNYLLTYNEELDCYIHNGFNNIFNNLLDEIRLLLDINNNVKNIIFTGHSLGAAISKIFSLYFNKTKSKKSKCITFACPLVGDQTFGNKFNEFVPHSYSFLCEKDFVINIPIFRKCNQNNCYNINEDNINIHKEKTWVFLWSLLKFDVATHRLRYLYKKIILDKIPLNLIKFDIQEPNE